MAVKEAFAARTGDMAAKAVLVALAYRANVEGQAWPSLASLAADLEMSERTLRRALDRLVDADLVEVIHRPGRSSVFHVDPGQSVTDPGQSVTHPGQIVHPELVKELVKEQHRDFASGNGFQEARPTRFVHSRDCACGGTGWIDNWDETTRSLIAAECPDGPQP